MHGLLLFVSQVVSRETGEEVGTINIQSITNEDMQAAKMSEMYGGKVIPKRRKTDVAGRSIGESAMHEDDPQASSAPKSHIDYYPSRASGQRVDMYGRRSIASTGQVSVQGGLPINYAYVNKEGYICLAHNSLHINTGISLSEVLEEPKIIGGCVFMASKENIVLNVKEVAIFMVKVRVDIVEVHAQHKRTINLVYIHSPFSSSSSDIEVAGRVVRLKQPDITRTFEREIANVYECKQYEGCVCLSRVYPGSSIVLYRRRDRALSHGSYFYLVFVPATLLLLLVLRGHRKIRVVRVVYEAKGYRIAKGEFDKSAVMVKIYRRGDERIHDELRFLSVHRHHGIVRYIYKEYAGRHLYIAFEHTYGLDEVTIVDRRRFYRELVDVLSYLHSEGLVYNNLAPANVRVSHSNSPVLINFEDISSKRCRVGTVNWRSAEIILNELGVQTINEEARRKSDVFSLGLLLYYLEYSEHPFEMADGEEVAAGDSRQPCHEGAPDNTGRADLVALDSALPIAKTVKKSVVYNGQDEFLVSGIEQNVLAGKFKLEYVRDQTFYSLITYCIKRRPEERYCIELVRHHPYFWSKHKIFNFLANVSDILENKGADAAALCKRLERNRFKVFKGTWMDKIDRAIIDNLCIRRTYNPNSVQSLLRAIRNKGRHYKELPKDIKIIYQTFPGGFVEYYMQLFPRLLMVCYISASCIAVEESLAAFYPQGPHRS
ncbi:UNVERIFIED_CONTAM: hypothetical protein PYX00_011462 [Menopon gallinae]|uniref:Uncharacterized protein n=1 Tax=Menopon gallinae TaxID=328185 RepID=A0AAW2H7Q8_9NEOP